VETKCNFFDSLTCPEPVDAGLRVAHLGASSVRYEIGIFRAGREEAVAQGHFVHVYVARETRRPVPLPAELREALTALMRQ
jgi:acyl-CoA thioester hydrolase